MDGGKVSLLTTLPLPALSKIPAFGLWLGGAKGGTERIDKAEIGGGGGWGWGRTLPFSLSYSRVP